MNKLALITLPIALAGSPAMSATYYVNAGATGLPQGILYSGATPYSTGGGADGATFTANTSNADGGSVSVFASEGVGDIGAYNGGLDHPYGLSGDAIADIKYTIRVVGPTSGALVPVHIRATVGVTSLVVPAPVGGPSGYYAPVEAGADGQVSVAYAEGDAPIGAPAFLAFVQTSTNYDYRYFEGVGYAAPQVLGNARTFDEEVMVAANFDVAVNINASAGADFTSAYAAYTETAEGGASADPTFAIDEPGYSAYTLTGLLPGPAAAATPEPATWAILLIGFAGLGYAGYRRRDFGARPRETAQ
ncbi:MAG TPA: PEP-CTERM sorting domain-containing protein [Roseiarcus sp.]|jgi:hypothetical protein